MARATKTSIKKGQEIVANNADIEKGSVFCVNCGIVHWQTTTKTVKKQKNTGNAKYERCYVVEITTYLYQQPQVKEKPFKTLAEAKAYALKQVDGYVTITKKPFCYSRSPDEYYVEIKVRITKNRPKQIPAGSECVPVFHYEFVGACPC